MFRKIHYRLIGSMVMALFLASVSFSILNEMEDFWNNSKQERIEVAEKAIKRAALQCYALEGSYPADLNYLVENYGILLNEDQFFYKYEIFASNIMPEVIVLEKPR